MQTNHVQKQEVQGQENGKTLFLAVKRETEKQVIIGAVYETKNLSNFRTAMVQLGTCEPVVASCIESNAC